MDFNYEPYWDDFEASNGAREQNYMRILFRPGYAVQARELTQIQSILQNQIKQFGNHMFRNGSVIYGGHMTFDKSVKYLKLKPQYANFDIDVTDYIDRVIFNQDGTARKRAKVVAVYDSVNSPTLMIRQLTGVDFVAEDTIGTSTGSLASVAKDNPTGLGSIAHIDEGVFYANGYFVYVAPQSLVLDAYSSLPTYKVGLEIDEEVMDESGDANLLDPAQSSFNYQAPGAHRYKFSLTLSKRTLDSTDDERFFELLRVESGNITKLINATQYADFENLLARRTYDESGNYVVNPFTINLSANTEDDTKIVASIGGGKAYVGGYDYSSNGVERLIVNKARTVQPVVDYDLSVSYGNYIITSDLKTKYESSGLPDLTSPQPMHMHCTTTDKITYTSAAAYYSTYMGTSRLVNIDRDGAEYIAYFADIGVTSNTFSTGSNAATNVTLKFPSTHSSQDGAYVGVEVKILSGDAYGDIRTITGYVGSTKTATVDRAFNVNIASGIKVELVYSKNNINSILQFRSGPSANAVMNVSYRSKTATNSLGFANTIIGDSRNTCLVYPLSDKYVKYNSMYNADYYYNKYINNVLLRAISATVAQADISFTTEGYLPFGSIPGTQVSSAALDQYLVVLNRNTGQIIPTSSLIVTILSTSGISISTATADSAEIYADIYLTLKVDNSENLTKRTKIVKGDSTTKTLTSASQRTGTQVTGQNSVWIDSKTGTIWFTDNSIINKNLGGATSLYVSDVFNIKAIYDSQDTNADPTLSASIDITERFLLDSGQRDMNYEHSSIILKPGAKPPSGRIVVLAQWFEHSVNAGYFCDSSYEQTVYNSGGIPTYYSSNTEKTYRLRDSIDFRPTRKNGTTALTYIGFKCVKPNIPMELSYSYYLPRIDSIVLTPDRSLKVIEGIPANVPLPPKLTDNSMELFRLNVPSYTTDFTSIVSTIAQTKRYTMKDIAGLETRINQIEYYTAMSLMEKSTSQKTILYSDTKEGTQKEKYGILVDNFMNFTASDTSRFDFNAAIDGGVLSPISQLCALELTLKSYDPNYIKVNDKTITLSYTETEAISQLSATSNVTIQPYLYGVFDGMLFTSPEVDTVHSFTLPPIIIEDKDTVITKDTELVMSNKVELSKNKQNIVKNHIMRWSAKVNKNYIAMSQTYNDAAYDSSPNQTIKNL